MNKKLSRLVALGLLATPLWQPVAILAESNTSTSSQTSSTATAGTQVVGNDTVGYLTLPEGYEANETGDQNTGGLSFVNKSTNTSISLMRLNATDYIQSKPQSLAKLTLPAWIIMKEVVYRLPDKELTFQSGPAGFDNLPDGYYLVSYKDSSAIGSVYFTDKNDSNYVYLIGMDGPNADSLSSFGDIAKTWSSKKP